MRRPNYGAVTGVVTAVSLAGIARLALQGAIPPPNPEIARSGQGEFVAQAAQQAIHWRPLGAKAFNEARSLSRPIFLVIGVPWSAAGRRADETLASPQIAHAIDRGFIPVRVDAAQVPAWISEFLPLQRATTGFDVGYQTWVFDVRGDLIDSIAPIDAQDPQDERTVVDALVSAQNRFAAAAQSEALPALEVRQREDARRLLELTVGNLALGDAADALASGLGPDGGWVAPTARGAIVEDRSLAIRFLQLAGHTDETGDALRRTVLSPRADWLDGGFFRALGRDTRMPEYDKVAVANAQCAETLAVQNAIRPDPVLREFARATVSWLLGLRQDGMVAAAEQGDEDERGRSARACLAPARLRDAVAAGRLSTGDRDWAVDRLGLGGAGGARWLAIPVRSGIVGETERLRKVLASLRASAGPRRARVATNLVDVNGMVAACLLRCARLWNDPQLAEQAGLLVDRIEGCRDDRNDVRHSLFLAPNDGAYLGDALAYADAHMEDFLTNGRVPSLELGAAVLRRALVRFRGEDPGFLRSSPEGAEVFAHHPSLFQGADDDREATAAMPLRLLIAYASALGAPGADFQRAASEVAEHVNAVLDAAPTMGGSLGALARYTDSRALFVVGPDALDHAARLARRFPNRWVVPVLGPVRPELRGRPPGVYLGTSAAPSGSRGEDDPC